MFSNKKQKRKNISKAVAMTILLFVTMTGFGSRAVAQFTFTGDYDRSFAAPLGYYVEQEDPYPGSNDEFQTLFFTGEYAPDGSIIAGGRFVDTAPRGDFYLKKFTSAGALDTTFGNGGYVRTNFHSRFDGVGGNDSPQVLKVQPDGKILFAGYCTTLEPGPFPAAAFGPDACVVRYNANGTLDQTFGGGTLVYTGQGSTANQTTQIEAGKVIFQTGTISSGQSFGTDGTYFDMAIQPDGKIVLVGETRNRTNFFVYQGFGAIIVRLNANGTLDSTFGSGGIARWTAPEGPAGCFPPRRFHAVRLQPDGRIIAVGFDSRSVCSGASATGNRFAVTRWTSSGQLETVRHLDNITAFDFQDERAVSVHLTRDASKILVSGSYRNLSGTPAGRQKPTMARFNIADLSLDATFGSGGIAQYDRTANGSTASTLNVKAIQPDGRLIGTDDTFSAANDNVIRFNPNGSPDLSFGNFGIDGLPGRGITKVNVINFNGVSNPFYTGQILVRPNGRINLIGYSQPHTGLGIIRAAVSQQNTVFENGVYSDFTNDGRTDVAVFRPSSGAWFYLNSSNNQSNGVAFGLGTDKIAPADYDGDGRTDIAVFRDGTWYLQQSTRGFAGVSFGAAGDLPRPGDFDGDGRADISVFRPSTGVWYRLNSSNGQFVGVSFGQSGDVPLLADFDGDARTDIAVFRQGFWYYLQSSNGAFQAVQFGAASDVPVPGDYDGDSKFDVAVFRESNGVWYRLNSTNAQFVFNQFGQTGDKAVPGDYDNDGKNDLAIFRSGIWYALRSGDNSVFGISYGAATDVPVPSAYLP
jgi:uncharacterized delta-60 repeat protein